MYLVVVNVCSVSSPVYLDTTASARDVIYFIAGYIQSGAAGLCLNPMVICTNIMNDIVTNIGSACKTAQVDTGICRAVDCVACHGYVCRAKELDWTHCVGQRIVGDDQTSVIISANTAKILAGDHVVRHCSCSYDARRAIKLHGASSTCNRIIPDRIAAWPYVALHVNRIEVCRAARGHRNGIPGRWSGAPDHVSSRSIGKANGYIVRPPDWSGNCVA